MKRILLSIAIFFTSASAHGASFDCAKAGMEVERIVCSNRELSELDSFLGDLYDRTYEEYIHEGYMPVIITQLVKDQRHWLRFVRNACKDVGCLKMAYENRINQIGFEIDDNDLSFRSMAMKCDYLKVSAVPLQEVYISGAVYGHGQSASIKEFSDGSSSPEHVSFVIKPGQFAECTYPSGFRVRAKVGEGKSYPYGICGGDPKVFLSLWINKRKVASRVWFAGHCREDADNNAPVVFRITPEPCVSTGDLSDSSIDMNQQPAGNMICVDTQYLSNYPVDLTEYPDSGTGTPKAGEYELAAGSGKVCAVALNELERGGFSEHGSPTDNSRGIEYPAWRQADLSQGFQQEDSGTESLYDFDNDGKLDRIIRLPYSSHYMDATVLLVQPGASSEFLDPAAPLQDEATISIPCQVSGQPSDYGECPPYSQKWDNAGFNFGEQIGENSVYFMSRYSRVEPFIYMGTSYVLVRNGMESVANYSAVLKPLPHRKFEHSCLIRQVVENY